MYESFFGLASAPFRLVLDPAFHFESREHARAQSYLHYALDRREGFSLITGAPGCGKTALMQVVLESLDPEQVATAHVAAVLPGEEQPLQSVAQAFECGLPVGATSAEAMAALHGCLTAHAEAGRIGVLVIDEAQNLAPQGLETLRLLANLQWRNQALLQIILVGQPELRHRVMSSAMPLLAQRVVAVCELGPLGEDEMQGYVEHRLRAAGCTDLPQFDPGVLRALHEASGGNPRAVNGLCERLLLLGFLSDRRRFTASDMVAVVAEMQDEWSAEPAVVHAGTDRF